MLWTLLGLALSLLAGALALRASRRRDDFYAAQVYGMSAQSHRRFALVCVLFAALFALAAAWPVIPAVPLFALLALALILYGSSFLRGYSDEDS